MKITALIKELQRSYEILNKEMFGGALKTPDFVFMPKKKVVIRYITDTNQMVLGGDFGGVDASMLILQLLHEMVHVLNSSRGIVDCRSNQYHNKEFMQAAVEVGLICVRHKNQGWVTVANHPRTDKDAVFPSDTLLAKRVATIDFIKFDKEILKQAKTQLTQLNKRHRTAIYFLKYECNCPPPHNSIRSGRRPDGDHPLNIKCLGCNAKFQCVDLDKGDDSG